MGFWETNVGQESHAFTTKVSDDAAADLQRWLGVSYPKGACYQETGQKAKQDTGVKEIQLWPQIPVDVSKSVSQPIYGQL